MKALNGMKEMAQIYGYDISDRQKMQKKLYSGCTLDIWQH